MMDLLAWLGTLPAPLLYATLLLAAFAENVFPPLPADTVIALGAFVAAHGNGSAIGVWTATMVGNVGGAMLMYGLGYRFGVPWLRGRFPQMMTQEATERFTTRLATQGMTAVAISRFLPGVRAVVPPMAGAFRIGAVRAAFAMTAASGVWYGIVCAVAFRAGANAEVVLAQIAAQQRWLGLGAAVLLLGAAGWWWRRRRRTDGGS
jgi:LPXTG-motif cell wall-anchored protein